MADTQRSDTQRSDTPRPDTQWPSFQVFEQIRPDAPHQNAGTLHAPDAEMALMMARDLFVRRPTCIGLWVVPKTKVFAQSAEQLADPEWRTEMPSGSSGGTFRVFQKTESAGTHRFVGTIDGTDPADALGRALVELAEPNALVWWVVPEEAFTESSVDDAESMFTPANDKTYRDQAEYHPFSLMRDIKRERAERSDGE